MAAVTAAVVATAVGVHGQMEQKKAQKKAASEQQASAISSARLIASSGDKAERELLKAGTKAAKASSKGAARAEEAVRPFVDPGVKAFEMAQSQILGGLPISGPLADSIRGASTQAILSRPEIFNTSGPVGAEIARQGDLSVSGASPAFTGNLLSAGQQGISAVGDVSGIRQRGLESLADIVGGTSSGRASALVGQTAGLQTLSQGANEARLLGQVAGQKANTGITEELAKLAGRIT